MELIVITPEQNVTGETELVNGMLEAGLTRLHIRKPNLSAGEYREYLYGIESRYHSRLVLHGAFELLREFHLGGIHLNSVMRESTDLQRLMSDIPVVSTSFHSWQEIRNNKTAFRYVFISPVFDSISKKGYEGVININDLKVLKEEIAVTGSTCSRIIALGGVGVKELPVLFKAGFDGAAMLGAVWLSDDPLSVVRDALVAVSGSTAD